MTDMRTAQASFTLYTTSTCGPCVRLKARLDGLGIPFDEVNVEENDDAAEWVRSVNAGDRVVPTLRFADGSSMTNPSVEAVLERLGRSDQGV